MEKLIHRSLKIEPLPRQHRRVLCLHFGIDITVMVIYEPFIRIIQVVPTLEEPLVNRPEVLLPSRRAVYPNRRWPRVHRVMVSIVRGPGVLHRLVERHPEVLLVVHHVNGAPRVVGEVVIILETGVVGVVGLSRNGREELFDVVVKYLRGEHGAPFCRDVLQVREPAPTARDAPVAVREDAAVGPAPVGVPVAEEAHAEADPAVVVGRAPAVDGDAGALVAEDDVVPEGDWLEAQGAAAGGLRGGPFLGVRGHHVQLVSGRVSMGWLFGEWFVSRCHCSGVWCLEIQALGTFEICPAVYGVSNLTTQPLLEEFARRLLLCLVSCSFEEYAPLFRRSPSWHARAEGYSCRSHCTPNVGCTPKIGCPPKIGRHAECRYRRLSLRCGKDRVLEEKVHP
jgi:hypothetical protein